MRRRCSSSRGPEGLFEVDEAWLPKVASELDPRLIVLGNLFRDQLDRYGELEHLADEWGEVVAARAGRTSFVLNADDPLVADLGRDADLQRRPGVSYFGIEDPTQALSELQHAFDAKHCRRCGAPYSYERSFVGHLGHYSCPNCGADRPAPDFAATRIELDGMRGSRMTVRTPDGEIEVGLPLPGLYNAYNALGAIAAAAGLGVPLDRAVAGIESSKSAFGRVETIPVAGKPVSILLIKNPAGANEVLRTLRLEGESHEEDGRLDLWMALNDRIADGRDVSWIWDADFEVLAGSVRSVVCAGTRAPEMALRLKYAGIPDRRHRGGAGHRALPGPGGRREQGHGLRPPHLHGPDRAAHAAGRARAGQGVLALTPASAPPAGEAAIWHDVECGAYSADLALWRELAEAAKGPILELGAGTGRVTIDLARAGHEVVAVERDPELAAALAERANGAVQAVAADALELDLGRRFALVIAPMQLMQVLGGAAARSEALKSVARHLADDGLAAAALVEGVGQSEVIGEGDLLPDIREVDGWVYSSTPLALQADTDSMSAVRRRQRVSPARRADRDHARRPARAPERRRARRAGRGRRPAQPRAPAHRRRRFVRGSHGLPLGARMSSTLRFLALYPDQMNIYADRGNMLFLRRRCEWRGMGFEYAESGPGEGFDPGAHDLIYIGGGQDRDQKLVAADMLETKRDAIDSAAGDGAVVLAVCGGYQLLGHSYELGSERIAGLGLADLETIREDGPRLIGNVAIEVDLGTGPQTLAGFENHGGRTHLGSDARPLGRVLQGFGNNGRDGHEGVRRDNLFGTYLHGPLLPKNAWLADRLTQLALARGGGSESQLEPLDDELERASHESAAHAAGLR